MNFRIIRVKRRVDQEPIEALYLPSSQEKRAKTETDFRLFKLVNRSEEQPSFRKKADGAKVVIISDLNDCTNVAEAVLMDTNDSLPVRNNSIDAALSGLSLSPSNFYSPDFVYDMYRIDLGRYTEADLSEKMVGIVTYEQELVHEIEESDSDFFQDEDDSNAEDYYANDYPEEESHISYSAFDDSEFFDSDSFFLEEDDEQAYFKSDIDTDDDNDFDDDFSDY